MSRASTHRERGPQRRNPRSRLLRLRGRGFGRSVDNRSGRRFYLFGKLGSRSPLGFRRLNLMHVFSALGLKFDGVPSPIQLMTFAFAADEEKPELFGDVLIDRTGVRFLLGHAEIGQLFN